MSDKAFDFIRFLAEIGITAIGAFYKGIAEVWNLPHGEAVLTTCVLLSTLIGVFVEWQRASYNKLKLELPEAPTTEPEELHAEIDAEDVC